MERERKKEWIGHLLNCEKSWFCKRICLAIRANSIFTCYLKSGCLLIRIVYLLEIFVSLYVCLWFKPMKKVYLLGLFADKNSIYLLVIWKRCYYLMIRTVHMLVILKCNIFGDEVIRTVHLLVIWKGITCLLIRTVHLLVIWTGITCLLIRTVHLLVILKRYYMFADKNSTFACHLKRYYIFADKNSTFDCHPKKVLHVCW